MWPPPIPPGWDLARWSSNSKETFIFLCEDEDREKHKDRIFCPSEGREGSQRAGWITSPPISRPLRNLGMRVPPEIRSLHIALVNKIKVLLHWNGENSKIKDECP